MRLTRHVLALASLLVIGGSAATSGPTSAGDGCARYLRQQARDREQARWKNRSSTPKWGRRVFQGEHHRVIDPSLSVAFHPSGEAPGAAVSLAAAPSPNQRFPGVRAPPAIPSSINRTLDPCPGRLASPT
jgi:hypothetical protein